MPIKRHSRVAPAVKAASRKLRREQTPAEKKLWRRLRDRQLGGFKFRRQLAIGRYVVDFCCVEAKLIVELDGDTHDGREADDERRTHELEKERYRVRRFMNSDVHERMSAVLEAIGAECRRGRRD
ncbi:MAG TPA: endonuclease domain-containing protein [Planctomycetota bacterium]|nr:endonuclease domain-containing protein [Planctomycetota bacterium]